MGTLKKNLKASIAVICSVILFATFTQCSSDSEGEVLTDDTINQGNTDDGPDNTGDDSSSGTDSDGVDATLQVNPVDPQWFTLDYDDGITVNFHGSKDDMGIPEDLTHIEFVEDDDNGAVFYVDEQNRISEMVYSDGTLFKFDWETNTQANLTVVSNDGSVQVNTEIDLTGTGKSTRSSNEMGISTLSREGGITINRVAANGLKENLNRSQALQQEVLLNVGQCGEPADAPLRPYFEIIDDEGNLIRTLFTEKVGLGLYSVNVPIPEPVDPNVELLCASLSSKISDFCTALDFSPELAALNVCPKVTEAMNNLPFSVSDDVKAGVLAACEKMVVDYLPRACERLGEGGTTINEKLCAAETSDLDLPVLSYMYGVIPTAPIDKVTESILLAPESSSIPDFFLDLGNDPIISNLALNPAAPVAGQNYSAVVSVGCVTPGTIIEIRVEGSDGFSDTATYTETMDLPSADYSISVPGGSQGVRDTITITVTLPDGAALTRTASLVFG